MVGMICDGEDSFQHNFLTVFLQKCTRKKVYETLWRLQGIVLATLPVRLPQRASAIRSFQLPHPQQEDGYGIHSFGSYWLVHFPMYPQLTDSMPFHKKAISKRDKGTPLARVQDRELLEMRDEGFFAQSTHCLILTKHNSSVALVNGGYWMPLPVSFHCWSSSFIILTYNCNSTSLTVSCRQSLVQLSSYFSTTQCHHHFRCHKSVPMP